jgi:hypothetical protein
MMVPMAMHRAELPSNQELEEVGWNRVWTCGSPISALSLAIT